MGHRRSWPGAIQELASQGKRAGQSLRTRRQQRLGAYLGVNKGGKRYFQAGLTAARTLFQKPYLSEDPNHEGLILHSIYHRPNGWDHVPKGKKVPQGESSMWGDYHAMELAVLIQRLADANKPYLVFFD